MITGRIALICLGLSGLSLISCKTLRTESSAAKASEFGDLSLSFEPKTQFGTWQGWGTSLAWWASAFGDRDQLADIFFTSKTTRYDNRDLPGLGFNIARFNAGASTHGQANGESAVYSTNMIRSRIIEGFWSDWNSEDPSSGSWNWSADPLQRSMMKKAQDRGVNRFELFSNSPMWWMLKNHNPSGAKDGKEENLQSWNLQKHAIYLATVAKYARDNWSVNFESVEPFNEPTANWWKDSGTQEGSHFSHGTMKKIIAFQHSELASRGLGAVMVSAADENLYDEAVATWNAFDSGTKSKVGRINVHGYQEANGRRDKLYSLAQKDKKAIWNSEYGEDDASGMKLAKNLLLDFEWLHPLAWMYWQVLDGGGWGLIQANNDDKWLGPVNAKYYVLAQFSRHIREGMTILKSNQGNSVAAYDSSSRKLIIVALNEGGTRWINFDLGSFRTAEGANGKIKRWMTTNDGKDLYNFHDDLKVKDRQFQVIFPEKSVQTFEIENVDI